MISRVGIIGHFGGDNDLSDGQTVKTKILYQELIDRGIEVVFADTYYNKTSPFKLIMDTLKVLLKTDDVIILLSRNGMKVFFPLLYLASRCFGKRIYHDVIGGNLADLSLKHPKYIKYLNSFVVNWIETENLGRKLNDIGVRNAEVLPNFKRLKYVDEFSTDVKLPYKLCTFSRVMEEKGIAQAVKAVKAVNKKIGEQIYTLEIYGQVDSAQQQWFSDLQDTFDESIKYCGVVRYDQSTEVLKEYFALLFPTLFYTEGVPGTIVDAYAAALPVVSSRWEHFNDVIIDDVTGIGYEFGNTEALEKVLLDVYETPSLILDKKQSCLEYAFEYSPEKSMNVIIGKINNRK